jgi:hypothetical protein
MKYGHLMPLSDFLMLSWLSITSVGPPIVWLDQDSRPKNTSSRRCFKDFTFLFRRMNILSLFYYVMIMETDNAFGGHRDFFIHLCL